jgi:hypothetical protein
MRILGGGRYSSTSKLCNSFGTNLITIVFCGGSRFGGSGLSLTLLLI